MLLFVYLQFKKIFQNQIFWKVRILSRIFKLVISNLSLVEEEVSIDIMLYNSLSVFMVIVSLTCSIGIGGYNQVSFKSWRKYN